MCGFCGYKLILVKYTSSSLLISLANEFYIKFQKPKLAKKSQKYIKLLPKEKETKNT